MKYLRIITKKRFIQLTVLEVRGPRAASGDGPLAGSAKEAQEITW
jgi:hypothetical protein